MKIFSALTTLLLLLITVSSKAQSSEITKSILQQNYFSEHFLRSRTSSLKIRSTKTIDSLFSEFQSSWEEVAPDTLKKYKLKMSLSTFKYIDAYCYLISSQRLWQKADERRILGTPFNCIHDSLRTKRYCYL